MKRRLFCLLLTAVFLLLSAAACGGDGPAGDPVRAPVSPPVTADEPPAEPEPVSADPPEISPEEQAEKDHAAVRSLLEKGLGRQNISYSAKFNSNDNEFVYEYYKRDSQTKMVTREGSAQSVMISDGQSTVYYNLPEKTGYRMMEAGDDMGLVPDTGALLNEEIYRFRPVGEETVSGLSCQVVETEDEFGLLKIWISKTLGLPVKYIGTDDSGWYSLELSEVQTGAPAESVFLIPGDIVIHN